MKGGTHEDYLAEWSPGAHLHVYNRVCYGDVLFRDDYDRRRFLRNVGRFVAPYLDIYAFNLLDDHYHLTCTLKSMSEMTDVLRKRGGLTKTQRGFVAGRTSYAELIAHCWKRCMAGYGQYCNKRRRRHGHLFGQGLRRVLFRGDAFHRAPHAYVLLNHEKHGWPGRAWTSLDAELRPAWVRHEELVGDFGGAGAFETYLRSYLKDWGRQFHALDEEKFFGIDRPPFGSWVPEA